VLQAGAYERLCNGGILNAVELDVLRWAMNARYSKPKRFQKNNIPMIMYKHASALEALVRCARTRLAH